ncbi:MAG: hypothetical protein GX601_13365, partial [Anaerolineales bacterium]|nr:hypothetical protein [Anaerolineales bacterium]
MDYRIEVFWQADLTDGRATDLLGQLAELGFGTVERVQVSDLYFVRGDLATAALDQLARELLADPVVEGYRVEPVDAPPRPDEPVHVIEVGYRPGVTDPVAWHLLQRARHLGSRVEAASTGKRTSFEGQLTLADLERIARELLCNDVIQTYALGRLQPTFVPLA